MSVPHIPDAFKTCHVNAQGREERGVTMTVTIRWFAMLREVRQTDSEVVSIQSEETLESLYHRLVPENSRVPVAFAKNHSLCSGTEPVGNGDEIAFLPPVGGG